MNDTQMEMTVRKFGYVYPLQATICKKCGNRFDEHKYIRYDDNPDYSYDRNVCPEIEGQSEEQNEIKELKKL